MCIFFICRECLDHANPKLHFEQTDGIRKLKDDTITETTRIVYKAMSLASYSIYTSSSFFVSTLSSSFYQTHPLPYPLQHHARVLFDEKMSAWEHVYGKIFLVCRHLHPSLHDFFAGPGVIFPRECNQPERKGGKGGIYVVIAKKGRKKGGEGDGGGHVIGGGKKRVEKEGGEGQGGKTNMAV